jgi:hypothetical protein
MFSCGFGGQGHIVETPIDRPHSPHRSDICNLPCGLRDSDNFRRAFAGGPAWWNRSHEVPVDGIHPCLGYRACRSGASGAYCLEASIADCP